MCIFIYYPFIMIYVYQAAGWPSIALFSKYLDEHRCFGSGFVSLFDVVLIVFKCSAVLIVFKCSAVLIVFKCSAVLIVFKCSAV